MRCYAHLTHCTGYRDTLLYMVNGLVFTGMFFFARMVPIVFLVIRVIIAVDDLSAVNPYFIGAIYISVLAACLLNVFWFYKIVKGVYKVLKAGKKHED